MTTVTIHHSATTATHPSETTTLPSLPSNIAIAGGGIVGLMLALALTQQGVADNSRPERTIHVFEQAPAFHDDVGACGTTH
jgi:glycine/D-amino acid oxidase-like deaminating enzyme